MIIKINGREMNQKTSVNKTVKNDTFTWKTVTKTTETVMMQQKSETEQPKVETLRDCLNRFHESAKRYILPLTTGVNLLALAPISSVVGQYSVPVASKTISSALIIQPVISMLQELALPIGIGMSIWGLIEICIGNLGGKDKIKYAILSYVGVFIIPYFFYQIHDFLGSVPLTTSILKMMGA